MDKSRLSQKINAYTSALKKSAPDTEISYTLIDLDAPQTTPLTPHATPSLYPVASCTKPMTAWLAWTLANQGHLHLDTPLSQLIPNLRLQDPHATAHLTLRDALCHRSGLPPHTWAWIYLDIDRPTFFNQRLPHLQTAGPYKQKHRYSNILYGAIGLACQTATNTPWETLIQEQLWTPLGMTHTHHLTPNWHKHPNIAKPLHPFHAQTNHPIAPSGEVISTAQDLGRWLTFLLKNKTTHAPLWQPQQHIRDLPHSPLHYTLGWRSETIDYQPIIWHTGSCTGYSSLTLLLPNQNYGLALLTNIHGIAPHLIQALRSILRNQAPKILHPPDKTPTPPPPIQTQPDTTYHHPGYGTLQIKNQNIYLNTHLAGHLTPDHLYLQDYHFSIPAKITPNQITLHYPSTPTPIRFILQT